MTDSGVVLTRDQRAVLDAINELGEDFTALSLAAARPALSMTMINQAIAVLCVKTMVRTVAAAQGTRLFQITAEGQKECARWAKFGESDRQVEWRDKAIRSRQMAGSPYTPRTRRFRGEP